MPVRPENFLIRRCINIMMGLRKMSVQCVFDMLSHAAISIFTGARKSLDWSKEKDVVTHWKRGEGRAQDGDNYFEIAFR